MTSLRGTAHRVFRALPLLVRRRLVRLLTPNYTVGAVVLVRDADGALLLLRQPPGYGWSLPGGLLNRREDAARAAARELAEETGIVAAPTDLTPASPNARVNTYAQQVDVVFTLTVDRDAAELRIDPVEVLEAGWHPVSQLPPLTVATARLLAMYGLGPYAGYGPDGAPLISPGAADAADPYAADPDAAATDAPTAADDRASEPSPGPTSPPVGGPTTPAH